MKLVFRLVSALLVALMARFFSNMVLISVFSLGPQSDNLWFYGVISLAIAIVAGWFVWTKTAAAERGLVTNILTGALLVGGIGFFAGFVGPLIFTPEANLGPLLGILITGPVGFVVGGFVGLAYWVSRNRRSHHRTRANGHDQASG